jgi:hypothetical protein
MCNYMLNTPEARTLRRRSVRHLGALCLGHTFPLLRLAPDSPMIPHFALAARPALAYCAGCPESEVRRTAKACFTQRRKDRKGSVRRKERLSPAAPG